MRAYEIALPLRSSGLDGAMPPSPPGATSTAAPWPGFESAPARTDPVSDPVPTSGVGGRGLRCGGCCCCCWWPCPCPSVLPLSGSKASTLRGDVSPSADDDDDDSRPRGVLVAPPCIMAATVSVTALSIVARVIGVSMGERMSGEPGEYRPPAPLGVTAASKPGIRNRPPRSPLAGCSTAETRDASEW